MSVGVSQLTVNRQPGDRRCKVIGCGVKTHPEGSLSLAAAPNMDFFLPVFVEGGLAEAQRASQKSGLTWLAGPARIWGRPGPKPAKCAKRLVFLGGQRNVRKHQLGQGDHPEGFRPDRQLHQIDTLGTTFRTPCISNVAALLIFCNEV